MAKIIRLNKHCGSLTRNSFKKKHKMLTFVCHRCRCGQQAGISNCASS